ncbi:MAG: cell wall-binding repeat-containing protein [Coriobacteriia bacterium]
MKSRLRLLVVVVVLVVMFATGVAEAVPVFTTSGLATSTTLNERDPEMDGEWVAYSYTMPIMPGSGTNVVLRNLRSGETTTYGLTSDANLTNPDVSQGKVVFEDDTNGQSNIYSYLWGYPQYRTQVASTTAEETMPRIDGTLIAWYKASDDKIHYNHDVWSVPDSANVTHLDVDNGRIFWSDALVTQNVYVFEPGIDTVSHKVYTAPSGADIDSISAHGDYVVMTVDSGGTRSAVFRSITDSAFNMSTTVGYEASAFHSTFAAAVGNEPSNVHFFDTHILGGITVASTPANESDPSLHGHNVVYEREATSINRDIYFAHAVADVVRTQGTDRYRTAIETSKAYFRKADTAVICTGRNFPDALTAVPLARAVHGPLLLCDTDAISQATIDELVRLGVGRVYMIGGTDVVSTTVHSRLLAAGLEVERLAGDDRYETAVAIATEMDTIIGPGTFGGAFFANGANFPDALALGPVAASKGWPILLVQKDSTPPSVDEFITSSMDEGGAVAGGADVVSENVRSHIVAAMGGAPPVYRWAGTDRYGTSVAVVEGAMVKRWIDADTIGVATGANFPDALGGGAAIGNYGGGLLLVGPTALPTSVGNWLSTNKYNVGRVDVFGGPDVVSDGVKNAIAAKLQ